MKTLFGPKNNIIIAWRLLISYNLEQLNFKLERKYWDLETCSKMLENYVIYGRPLLAV
jgi:hypothetical protein